VGVQVLGVADGSFIAVGELAVRDRGVSRFEESVGLTGRERDRARSAALFAAAEAGLRGAGTVELDGPQVHRVVPRLQASHALVELVHGVDLVEQQLRIAAGEPVSYTEVEPAGCAVGVRVYAVDPVSGRPDPGRLTRWVEPPGVRVDAGYREGDVVPPHYDPLLAVLTVVAPDRAQALARAREAVDAFVVEGVRTNLPLLAAALADPDRTVDERLRA
jgi:acetyl-CoA carboxylase biotin carboxylase subunit